MCRLMGYAGPNPVSLQNVILDAPNGILRQSVCDRDSCKPNDDGWGFGFEENGQFHVIKEASAPRNDKLFLDTAHRPFKRVMLHIRRASVGGASKVNTHPWMYHQDIIFAHNGSVYGIENVMDSALAKIDPALSGHITGNTDSEYAMHLFLTYLRKYNPAQTLDIHFVRTSLQHTIADLREISRRADASRKPQLNFMMLTRDYLIATKVMHSLGYYTSYQGGTLVTSEALDNNDGWTLMKEETMIVVSRNGDYALYDI